MQRLLSEIPAFVTHVTTTLENAGFEAHLVGGCVRDLLLGRSPSDWDITTNAKPEEIEALFEHAFYENDFGTVGVVDDNATDEAVKIVEVTTYRTESTYSDNRRPDSVSFSTNVLDDLKRRDFTVNAIALRLPALGKHEEIQWVDPFNGQSDLELGLIRAVGTPRERFDEDALRLLRAVRLAGQLGFVIEAETQAAIAEYHERLATISQERIRDELVKILMNKEPMLSFGFLLRLGLLKHVIPELLEGLHMEQTQAHSYDVFEHSIRTLEYAAEQDWPLPLRLAALFHDIGKPFTHALSKETGQPTFYGHEVVGAKITKNCLKRLKFSGEIVSQVTTLVRWHMFFSDPDLITLSAVRRMLARVGEENMELLVQLRKADRIGSGRPKAEPYRLRKYQAMVEEAKRDPVSVKMLKIDGTTIMKEFDVKPGPVLGNVLHALLGLVLEDPNLNTTEFLMKQTRELLELPENELIEKAKAGKLLRDDQEEQEIKDIRSSHHVQ